MVKNILQLLAMRQNTILSGASILMLTVFLTKILGLVRDRLLVHTFNTTDASIFFAAFGLPDLLFNLLVFGTLSVAFIPIFTDHLSRKTDEESFAFASKVLNLSLFVFLIVAIFCFIFVSQVNNLVVPGFSGEQKALTDQLTRIILIAQIFLIVGSFFVAISQSFQRFIIPSLAPLFYNLGIIGGILFLTPIFGLAGTAIGVVVGALLHAVIQIPMVKSLGFKYTFSLDFLDSGIRQVFKMMSLRNIGLVAEQINERVGFALATLISTSAAAQLTLAQHLQVVPIGLFGATIAQAALPILSREAAKGEIESFKITLLTTLHQILFLTLPAAAILIALRTPVVRLVFGASQFNWDDTVLTGITVSCLSLGLVAQSVVLLVVRGFYALKDTKTPVLVSITTVTVNIALSYLFVAVLKLEVWALGLSYAVATNLSGVLLIYFLYKKLGGFDMKALLFPAAKMLLAASVASLALYIPIQAWDETFFDTTRTVNLLALTGIAATFGISIYLILIWLLRVQELQTFVGLIKKIGNFQNKLQSKELVSESDAI